ncbi:MAG TPA: hypothetical protein VFY10_04275 [Dehalococcoidia bacterium]|nr:hypothetical protein [Dehalococcoidia bacterium]
MFFWLLWSTIFLVVFGFFVQSLVLYLKSKRRQRPRPRRTLRFAILAPDLVALESQYFVAPQAAIAEARAICLMVGAPQKLFEGKLDQASFCSALVELQAHRPDVMGASRVRRRS